MFKPLLKNILLWLMGLCAFFKITKTTPQYINIVGDLFSESGLGSVTRQIIASIDGRYQYQIINLPLSQKSRQQAAASLGNIGNCLKPGITIFIGNPEILPRAMLRLNPWRVINNYNIGVWFWELEKLPPPWHHLAPLMDEVWAQSNFVKRVFEKDSRQVRVMPFSLDAVVPSHKSRVDFGLPENKFIFLFTFDYLSHAARKNPQAVIESFKRAFGESEEVLLVIKTVNSDRAGAGVPDLRGSLEKCRNIVFFDEYFQYKDLLRLIQLANCYVSLHRSEGLGLGLAEAMKLGTLVMATNYSGNTDFMNAEDALMVDFTLTPVLSGDYPYGAGNFWAEPSQRGAIKQMQYAFSHREECHLLVQRAQEVVAQYTSKHQGDWIQKRLMEIS
jgi:glycosyltransferase involved in cell wall biosynthesis